jgi:hypothetical protein
VVTEWLAVASDDDGLAAVLDPRFDPDRQAIVNQAPPGLPRSTRSSAGLATAAYSQSSPEEARVVVQSPAGGLLVIRTSFDPHWRAWVDGRPVAVVRADFALQGVPVPAGEHTVALTYVDPSIGLGVLGSLLSVLALAGGAALSWRRSRRSGPAAGA